MNATENIETEMPEKRKKTDCLYCHEEFNFDEEDVDDVGWIYCPKCEGAHETKGFVNWDT